jgi:hypothetical protein
MGDGEDRERARMDAEAFARLPESVRNEILAKRAVQEQKAAAYAERVKQRRVYGAIVGAVGAVAASLMVPSTLLFNALLGVSGAVWGWIVVDKMMSHLAGICIFGVNAIVLSLVGKQLLGWMGGMGDGFVGAMMMCSWLFQMGVGFLVAKVGEDARGKEDAF